MSKPLKIAVALSVAVLFFSGGYASYRLYDATMSTEARTGLPILYEVPEFSLTDSQGQRFTRDDLNGQVWVAEFFFTSCPAICPAMMTQMARVQEAFADEPRVHSVGFSVDPETDTPERMAKYLERYGGDPARWHLLTGPLARIASLSVNGFKLGSVDTPAQHSTRFALVDGKGRIRGYYDGLDPESVDELIAAIRRLL